MAHISELKPGTRCLIELPIEKPAWISEESKWWDVILSFNGNLVTILKESTHFQNSGSVFFVNENVHGFHQDWLKPILLKDFRARSLWKIELPKEIPSWLTGNWLAGLKVWNHQIITLKEGPSEGRWHNPTPDFNFIYTIEPVGYAICVDWLVPTNLRLAVTMPVPISTTSVPATIPVPLYDTDLDLLRQEFEILIKKKIEFLETAWDRYQRENNRGLFSLQNQLTSLQNQILQNQVRRPWNPPFSRILSNLKKVTSIVSISKFKSVGLLFKKFLKYEWNRTDLTKLISTSMALCGLSLILFFGFAPTPSQIRNEQQKIDENSKHLQEMMKLVQDQRKINGTIKYY